MLKSAAFRAGAAVFLLAFLVRAVYLLESSDNPTFDVPVVDSMSYDRMARDLAGGEGPSQELFWQPPFYPLFLSAVYWLTGSSILAAKIAQMALGALTAALVYQLGRRIFDRRIGILAGVIAALYAPSVFFDGELLATGWASFWSVAMVLLLLGARERADRWRCAALGACAALAVVTRPVFLPFLLAGGAWLIAVWRRGGAGSRSLALRGAALVGGFLLVAAPIGLLNLRTTGRASILPYSGGANLYIGNNPDRRETITIRPGLQWEKLVELPAGIGLQGGYRQERYYVGRVVDYAKSDPVGLIEGLVAKTLQFASSRELPRNVDVYLFRRWSLVLSAGIWKAGLLGFPFGALAALAALGALQGRRRVPAPVWLFLLLYPAAVVAVFVTARYRVPAVPILCVLAAAGLAGAWRIAAARRWVELAVAACLVGGVALASSFAGPFSAETVDFEPELHYGLGGTLEGRGRHREAEDAYRRALELRPDYAEAHNNLGSLLRSRERLEEAIEHYRRAIALEPEYYEAIRNLGAALQLQGQSDEAVAHFRRALEINPDYFDAYNDLGVALGVKGDPQGAVRHFRRALEIAPGNPGVLLNLGYALQLLGQLDEAVGHLRSAVQLAPGNAQAHYLLAQVLARLRQLDEAVMECRRALEIEPGHPRARELLQTLLARPRPGR